MVQMMKRIISLSLILVANNPLLTHTFRIKGSEDESKPFTPYEKGFVGTVGIDPYLPTRVNQGYESMNFDVGHNRLQKCPGMVGPLDDGKFYCLGKEYGYCDRRSGTCFCNEGYSGTSCEACDPSHFSVGTLCYKKIRCPNDCSNAGVCNYFTGKCQCDQFRYGQDCSLFSCSQYHPYCTECNHDGCTKCIEGYSVKANASENSQCEPCYRFDPRCNECNEVECLQCIDLLLKSIHRSGRRLQDPELPPDELSRELSTTIPFGSLQTNAFDEAEYYELVDPNLVPLKEYAMNCDQGLDSDSTFSCTPANISHVVCGHPGVFTFLSPEYEILENAGHIRLTVQRTGGGAGNANVSYSIQHLSTNDSDVTPTAFYAYDQVLEFNNHEIRKSFAITINDDILKEGNEKFSVFLYNPTNLSRLGNQYKTTVTILDDDFLECTGLDEISIKSGALSTMEGESVALTLHRGNCDMIDFEHRLMLSLTDVNRDIMTFLRNISLFSKSEGTTVYEVMDFIEAGEYNASLNALNEGGLIGTYYSDHFSSVVVKSRVDNVVNFTWSESTSISALWKGFILPLNETDCCTFYVSSRNVRLWIDQYLVIDEWNRLPGEHELFSGFYDLDRPEAIYEIILEIRKPIVGLPVQLMWSSATTDSVYISSSHLFWKESIADNFKLFVQKNFSAENFENEY